MPRIANQPRRMLKCAFLPIFLFVLSTTTALEAAILIDSFETRQSALAVGPWPNGFNSRDAAEALGGNRDIEVQLGENGRSAALVHTGTRGSGLYFNPGNRAGSEATIVWDGTDRMGLVDTFGLGGLDLTESGDNNHFELFATADLGAQVTIRAYYGDDVSEATIEIPAGRREFSSLKLPFDQFQTVSGTGSDFSRIGAIELSLLANERTNIGIISFAVVPEPATLIGALGLGVAAVVIIRKRGLLGRGGRTG